MSLSSTYSPRFPSPSPAVINSRIRKTTINRSPVINLHNVRIPKSFTKSRRTTTKLLESKITDLLGENNVLKHWWAIEMQDRPEIQNHNPTHQWRANETYFREPRRQAAALVDWADMSPQLTHIVESRIQENRRTTQDLEAARAEIDEVNQARARELDMLDEATAMQAREAQRNEVLNERLDQLEGEKGELERRVGMLEGLEEKIWMVEDALDLVGERLEDLRGGGM